MTIKPQIVAALLRLYPEDWQREYGPELADLLLARPLGVRTIGDVLWSGLRERVRRNEPSTLVGLATMLVILTGLAWNIAVPPSSGSGRWAAALLRESSKTLPIVIVPPLDVETSWLYVLVLVSCGAWTHLRRGRTAFQSGMAAVTTHFIGSLPVMLAGILMATGTLGVVVLAPGDTPTTFSTHGFALTYYNSQHHALSPWAVVSAPLFRLPGSWIWGAVGGQLARCITRVRRSQTSASGYS